MCKAFSRSSSLIILLLISIWPNLVFLTTNTPIYRPGGGGETVAISAEIIVRRETTTPINSPI